MTLNLSTAILRFLNQQVHCNNYIFPKQQINNLIHLTFIPYYETVMGTKITKQQDYQITWTKVDLVLNLGHGIRKSKVITRCLHDVNAKGIYYKKIWSTSLTQNDNEVINKNDSNYWQGKSNETKNCFHTKNQTWTLVDLPFSKKKHTTTWVYKVKMHVNDIITKLKLVL
jgi:hypothetical protein